MTIKTNLYSVKRLQRLYFTPDTFTWARIGLHQSLHMHRNIWVLQPKPLRQYLIFKHESTTQPNPHFSFCIQKFFQPVDIDRNSRYRPVVAQGDRRMNSKLKKCQVIPCTHCPSALSQELLQSTRLGHQILQPQEEGAKSRCSWSNGHLGRNKHVNQWISISTV